ncbi:MAG: head-tail connector protein [Blastomonas sp.]
MLFTLTPVDLVEGYGEGILSLADAKKHLRVDADYFDDDDLIGLLRDAAIDAVEKYCNLRLDRTVGMQARFEGFGPGMRMGVGPEATVEVTAISYVDSAGADAPVADGGWRLDVLGRIIPAVGGAWPTTHGPVTVTFDAGYTPANRPPALLQAARFMLAHLYAQREAVLVGTISGDLPLGFRFHCDRYRMPVI